MKLISVVIPCYNHGKYLEEAVQCVLDQTYQNFEIVIVNDGSTDKYTIDLLNVLDKPKCRVLHTDNQGLSAARNNGIKSTNGEYICCLDADDKYHPEYFSKAVAVLESDEKQKYGAIPAWVQFFGNRSFLWKTIGHNTEGFEPYLQGLRNNIQSATMFRRICWEKTGGFDEAMSMGYEDWDYWIRILDHGYEWFCLEEPLIYYRQKEQSMVTRADEVRPQILKDLILKNHGFYVKHMVSLLLARDEEVLNLQQTLRLLQNRVATEECNDDNTKKDTRAAFLWRKVMHALNRFFPAR